MDDLAERYISEFVADSRQLGLRDALGRLTGKLGNSPEFVWLGCAQQLSRIVAPTAMREFLAAALRRWPQSAALRFCAAEVLWQEGQVEAAEQILLELLARHPEHAQALTLLAKLRRSQGRLDEASGLMMRVCRQPDVSADALLQGVQFVQQCQRHRLAAELCEQAFARGQAKPALLALAGNIERELGHFDIARDRYHAALAAGVDLNAWFVPGSLASTQRFDSTAQPDFILLETQYRNPALSLRARATTGFGLAKACGDIGDYARAAQVLREANALARQVQPWSRQAWQDWIAQRRHDRNGPPLAPRDDFVPIFIVGLPRTGTTLTAVQLGKSADVRDRGELPHLGFIARQLADNGRLHDAAALREAAELYFAHARQDDAPACWYIDQDPLNFRYLDLIATLFPQARIIHCRRDRRDTALSIWSQFFAHTDYGFACDFDDIAAFASAHDELMRHWNQTLQLPIYTLDYEDLVADSARVLAQLRAFVGLPAGAAATDAADSTITSASMWQARQPIHASSVGRWRRYRHAIPELESLFGSGN